MRRASASTARDLGDVVRDRHRPRDRAVGARVGGVADQVERAAGDPLGPSSAQQLAAQRLRACPAATQSGARVGRRARHGPAPGGSGAIRSMPAGALPSAHSSHMPLAHRDLHEPRPVLRAIAVGERVVQLLAPCDLARGHAVAARDGGDVEAREVERRRARASRARRTT